MSKERLEEIKRNWKSGYEFVLDENKEFQFDKDFEWLIEQAEQRQALETTVDFYQSSLRDADKRVQELEEEINDWREAKNVAISTVEKELKLKRQNKRYREAIESVKNKLDTVHFREYQTVDFRHEIFIELLEALEVEE